MVFPQDSCEHLSLRRFLKESSVGIFNQESQIRDSLHAKPLHDVRLNVPFLLFNLKIWFSIAGLNTIVRTRTVGSTEKVFPVASESTTLDLKNPSHVYLLCSSSHKSSESTFFLLLLEVKYAITDLLNFVTFSLCVLSLCCDTLTLN